MSSYHPQHGLSSTFPTGIGNLSSKSHQPSGTSRKSMTATTKKTPRNSTRSTISTSNSFNQHISAQPQRSKQKNVKNLDKENKHKSNPNNARPAVAAGSVKPSIIRKKNSRQQDDTGKEVLKKATSTKDKKEQLGCSRSQSRTRALSRSRSRDPADGWSLRKRDSKKQHSRGKSLEPREEPTCNKQPLSRRSRSRSRSRMMEKNASLNKTNSNSDKDTIENAAKPNKKEHAKRGRKQSHNKSSADLSSFIGDSSGRLLFDEHGFPMKSDGCPAVASLNTTSQMDVADPDAPLAEKLQQEEFRRHSSSKNVRGAAVRDRPKKDCWDEDDDRKMPATSTTGKRVRRTRSLERPTNHGSKQVTQDRKGTETINNSNTGKSKRDAFNKSKSEARLPKAATKNSEEAHHPPPSSPKKKADALAKAQQKEMTVLETRASDFVQQLQQILYQQRYFCSEILQAVFSATEMLELIKNLQRTQTQFQQQKKPHYIDIGYHYCRENNLRKIQETPGFWMKLQARGANKSEDGDGVYTFSTPLAGRVTTEMGNGDAWLLVARIQGNRSDSSAWASSCPSAESQRRKWKENVDATSRASGKGKEDDVVVLKTSAQVFPLLHFRQGAIARGQRQAIQQVHTSQQQIQELLDRIFHRSKKSGISPPTWPMPEQDMPRREGFVPARRPSMDSVSLSSGSQLQEWSQRLVATPTATGATKKEKVASASGLPRSISLNKKGDIVGRSFEFVHSVQVLLQEVLAVASPQTTSRHQSDFITESIVSTEELLGLAENMVQLKQQFQLSKKPAHIDIGYHYCRGVNVKRIKGQPGFWTSLQSRGLTKSEDGDGIYTFNNPLGIRNGVLRGGRMLFNAQAGGNYADAWLVVARIQGNRVSAAAGMADANRHWGKDVDAIYGGSRGSEEVVVCKSSSQVFPIVSYSAAAAYYAAIGHDGDATEQIQNIHRRLQMIVDRFLNDDGGQTSKDSVIDAAMKKERSFLPVAEEEHQYEAPEVLSGMSNHHNLVSVYHQLIDNKLAGDDDCAICLDPLRWRKRLVARLKVCGHEFHQMCLDDVLQQFDLCPICNQFVKPPPPKSCVQGISPSGTMAVRHDPQTWVQGCWAPLGTLSISYCIPRGLQKAYHEHPGTAFGSSRWQAYLPHNLQGARLLKRLQYAFLHGLTFNATSLLQEDRLVGTTSWSSIPHKTRVRSSLLGENCDIQSFPDASYFAKCHEELDQWGVPATEACVKWMSRGKGNANQKNGKPSRESSAVRSEMTPATPPPSLEAEQSTKAQSLRKSTAEKCHQILGGLRGHQHGWMFAQPLMQSLDEHAVAIKPMDLPTVEAKLCKGRYSTVDGFRDDVLLIFDNAIACHSKDNPVHFMAKQLKKSLKQEFREVFPPS